MHRIFWNIFCSSPYPYINVFVVYILMQELFTDKIHFFKFISTSDKPWLDRLKFLQYCFLSRGTSFFWKFHLYKQREIPKRKGKYPAKNKCEASKISSSIASLVFRKFPCRTYRNGLNRCTSRLGYSEYLKKYETC